MKACSKCGTEYPRDREHFYSSPRASDGLSSWCKPCQRESNRRHSKRTTLRRRDYRLRRSYGIGTAEYNQLLEAQGGVCAICSEECATGRALAVDHDHDSGAVRGLLCARCNRGLGMFGDNLDRLNQAVAYLKEASLCVC